MRVAWVLLHLSACGALRLSSTDDPSFEVGPTWIKHRSLSQAAAPSGARLGGCQSGLAVCIVGQLARLETKSKLANLFQFEAQQKTYERVHAFVVAQTGPWFNVSAKNAQAKDDNDTCRQEFHTPSEVEEVLSPYYQAGMYLKPGYHKEVTLNMENWHKYGTDKGEEKRKPRMKSHLAQWSNFAQCAGLIKEHEQATGCQYTAVMKIRDNGIVTKPMSTSVENKDIVKDSIKVTPFADDKAAVAVWEEYIDVWLNVEFRTEIAKFSATLSSTSSTFLSIGLLSTLSSLVTSAGRTNALSPPVPASLGHRRVGLVPKLLP